MLYPFRIIHSTGVTHGVYVLTLPVQYYEHLILEDEHVLHLTLVLEDWEHRPIISLIIASDVMPSVCLSNYGINSVLT